MPRPGAYLIQKRGAELGQVFDRGWLPNWSEWASSQPCALQLLGQPVVKYGRLKRFYDANLQRLRQMHPPVALIEEPQVIEPGPEACDDDSLECMLAKVSQGL